MKFLTKKIYIILFLLTIFFYQPETYARDGKIQYTKENNLKYFPLYIEFCYLSLKPLTRLMIQSTGII